MKMNIMNKNIQFINKKNELEFLKRQADAGSALSVIYGRRRVGKSELIKHFIRSRRAIYFQATQEVEKELAAALSSEFAEFFGDNTLRANPFPNLPKTFSYLEGKQLEGVVIAIDEFPYLVAANRSVPSVLQKLWDSYLRTSGCMLILCGSSMGAMETEVLGRKSPLYGRRTGQWKVEPLSFTDYAKFFPGVPFSVVVEFYSITGGMPLYALQLDGKKSAYENARDSIASRGALLYDEAEAVMRQELREPKTYFSIVKNAAAGKTSFNELSTSLGIERTALVRYLDTLIGLGILFAEMPMASKKNSKGAQYVLSDNYLSFWFLFVSHFKKELDSFNLTTFEKNFSLNFNTYVGRRFEGVCTSLLSSTGRFGKLGRYWGMSHNGKESAPVEIDIVAEEDGGWLFCECKWSDGVDARATLDALEAKARNFPFFSEASAHYAIFAKSFLGKNTRGIRAELYDLAALEHLARNK